MVHWTPDDELLLRNAIEGGASLESLAKGAVDFSQRYTIREVKERWNQILFDEAKALETSTNIMNLGLEACLPGNLRPGKLLGSRDKERPPGKRKNKSLRSLYYALRKRVRSGQDTSPEMNYLASTSAAVDGGFEFEVPHEDGAEQDMEGNLMIAEQVIPSNGLFGLDEMVNGNIGPMEKLETISPEENQNPSLQNLGFSPSLVSMRMWEGIESMPTHPIDPNPSSSGVQESEQCDDVDTAGPNDPPMIGDNGFVDISMDFDHEDDELFLLDEEEENVMDQERLDLIFTHSPVNVIHDAPDMAKDVKDIDANDTVKEKIEFAGDQKGYAKDSVPDTSGITEIFMICTLNTEDWEIPDNDDVILPNEVSFSTAASSGVGSKKLEPESSFHSLSGKIPPSNQSEMDANATISKRLNDSLAIKKEFLGMKSDEKRPFVPAVSLLARSILTPKKEVVSVCTQKCGDSFQEKQNEPPDRPKTDRTMDSAGPSHRWTGEPQFDSPSQNSSSSEDDRLSSDSEEEMPHFSDVESMILDMDLDLSDPEPSIFAREASRYQFMESKKTLMRLEKSFHCKTERSIMSHGAFALLHGRHLRHYIRKPEVSLGRRTDDIPVDIDLRKEGPANKISRRQAIIKMDEQGAFYLKNTGKFPILNNGSEVLPGMQVNICSGCLIDIRGMKFLFEVCPSRVRRYIANTQPSNAQEE